MRDADCRSMYWPFIEKNLPNYYRRDDVLYSDILMRYLSDEEVCETDLKWIRMLGSREAVVVEFIQMETLLFRCALESFLSDR